MALTHRQRVEKALLKRPVGSTFYAHTIAVELGNLNARQASRFMQERPDLVEHVPIDHVRNSSWLWRRI
jgi:hypothetical protein